jgi:ubiquinone/menaquinone biosynthesis C-methylase UbiE
MRLFRLYRMVCVSWLLMVAPALAQEQAAESPGQEAPSKYTFNTKDHDFNGIGKFYMGREIARVMGYPAANWLERPQREKEEQLTKLVESLKLKPGMVVADIGAGSGRISEMISPIVGPKGKVLAVDIQEEMLGLIREKAKQKNLTNIEPILSTEKSPKLASNTVDLAFMVDVYHEFSYPYEMTQELARALKPGGRLVFVEYRKEDPKVRRMIKLAHTMTEAQVKKEAEQPEFGLKWKETLKDLPVQHIIIFEKQPPEVDEGKK